MEHPDPYVGTGPEHDLCPRSAGLDPGALGFAFRPLWQRDAASAAAIALQKAQETQIYAGLGLWPAEATARLVEAQLVQDGTYPNAAAVFAEKGAIAANLTIKDYSPSQPLDPDGRWATLGHGFELAGQSPSFSEASAKASGTAGHKLEDPQKLAATTKDFRGACRALRLDPKGVSKALHAAKKAAGLAGDDNFFQHDEW